MALKRVGSTKINQRTVIPGIGALIVCVLISFLLITLSVRVANHPVLGILRAGYQTAVYPVQMVGRLVLSPVQTVQTISHNATAQEATLTELEEENARLKAENARLAEYEQENKELSALLETKNLHQLKTLSAGIIALDETGWTRTITINKGAMQGIEVNMPVVGPGGLIGSVISVGPASAAVRLVTDERAGVSVMVQKNRTQAVVNGTLSGMLSLEYLPLDTDITVGDAIITSGLGGVYPRGILVGTVTSVNKAPTNLYAEVTIKPAIDVSRLREVLVVTSLNDPDNQPEYKAPEGQQAVEGEASSGASIKGNGADKTSDQQAKQGGDVS